MSSSFHNADRPDASPGDAGWISVLRRLYHDFIFRRPLPDNNYVLVKADKLVRTAGKPIPMN
jgi:hypothetical protein